MTKTILIYPEDIIPSTKFMRDKLNRLDLLGQILLTGYGVKIHANIESPAHQGTVVSPFTTKIRNRVHNTSLTLQLLRNATLPAKKQIELANNLLDPHDIYLEEA